jgi:hypothetical protein
MKQYVQGQRNTEIHLALLSQFSLLAELLIGKVLVTDKNSRVLKLVNLPPGFRH